MRRYAIEVNGKTYTLDVDEIAARHDADFARLQADRISARIVRNHDPAFAEPGRQLRAGRFGVGHISRGRGSNRRCRKHGVVSYRDRDRASRGWGRSLIQRFDIFSGCGGRRALVERLGVGVGVGVGVGAEPDGLAGGAVDRRVAIGAMRRARVH